MDITYLGHSSFKLRGKTATVVTDPYDRTVGFGFPRIAADVVTISHEHADHNQAVAVGGTARRPTPFVIRAPGEYEVSGVSVFGVPTFHDSNAGEERGKNTVYVIHVDDLSLVHLGDLGHRLSDRHIEEIGGVDILLVPVGGVYTIGPKEAIEVIGQLQPSLVIPMHYRTPGHDRTQFGGLVTVEAFLTEGGFDQAKRLAKLSLTKTSLPEETEVVVLTP